MDSLTMQVDEPAEYEADVIIIGFGSAGGCAVIEARDFRAEVLLLCGDLRVSLTPITPYGEVNRKGSSGFGSAGDQGADFGE